MNTIQVVLYSCDLEMKSFKKQTNKNLNIKQDLQHIRSNNFYSNIFVLSALYIIVFILTYLF
jgi:hypothetical protein